jgi:hypothetical protein
MKTFLDLAVLGKPSVLENDRKRRELMMYLFVDLTVTKAWASRQL